MKRGDLVTLRMEEKGKTRFLVPGLIVDIAQKKDRTFYRVLARNSVHVVTDNDLGPIDISLGDREDVIWELGIGPV